MKWIPCEERLPDGNREVLISLEWGIDIGVYERGEWRSEWINHYDDDNVLAWMPLPQPYTADRKTEPMKTTDYCDICKRDMCEVCIADATNPYCVPSHYEINYESKDEPTTKTETQNSNLTFEKDECAKEYEDLGLKELKELIEADRKTEQTEREGE